MPPIHRALLPTLRIPGLSSLQFPNFFTLSYFTIGAPGGYSTDDLIFTPYARLEHVLGDPRSALSLLCPWESQFSGFCCLQFQVQFRAWVDNIQRPYCLVCKVTVLWASGLKFKCIRGMTRPVSLSDLQRRDSGDTAGHSGDKAVLGRDDVQRTGCPASGLGSH